MQIILLYCKEQIVSHHPRFLLFFQDYYDGKDDSGFSNVFPLWRDFGRESSLRIDEEEKPNLFSPKK